MNEQIKQFIKEHKKELIVAGAAVVIVGGSIVVWNLPGTKKATYDFEERILLKAMNRFTRRHNELASTWNFVNDSLLVKQCKLYGVTIKAGDVDEFEKAMSNAAASAISKILKTKGIAYYTT